MLQLCLLLSVGDGHESKIGLDKTGKFKTFVRIIP
jgi:hypothetical protein